MKGELQKEKAANKKLCTENSNVLKKLKTTKQERDRWQSRFLELQQMSREDFIECDRKSMADKGFDA